MPYFSYNGNNIYYNESGEGEPLLLLHGNTASSKMFDEVIGFYERYFRVIRIDFLGHGQSDRLERFPIDLFYDEAMQVIAFIRQSPYDKVSIIGSSGGAIVALNVALECPDLVNKVIADSFEGEKPLPGYADIIREEREASKQDDGSRSFYEYNHGEGWEQVVDNDTEALYNYYNTIGQFYHKPLSDLKIPVLLTGSEKDEFIPPGFFQETYGDMIKQTSNLTMHLFKTGGHPAMLSNSKLFSELANQFFKKTN